ncbi:MAG: hypothetical protein H0W86_06370 [Armatimonadetes bacterium]|nr:hypothetical protein [Armatimonadota bacterium]
MFELKIQMEGFPYVRIDVKGIWHGEPNHVILMSKKGEAMRLEKHRSEDSWTLKFLVGRAVSELNTFAEDLAIKSMEFARSNQPPNRS